MLTLIVITAILFIFLLFVALIVRLVGTMRGQNGEQTTKNVAEAMHFGGGKKDPLQGFGIVHKTPNLIRAVVAGDEHQGDILGYISTVEGMDYGNKILKIDVPPQIEWAVRFFLGRQVYGFPIIRKIRPLTVDRVVEKPTKPGEKRGLAEELESSTDIRYGLYGRFPRRTHHGAMDTRNKVRFAVNSLANLEVFDPEPIFTVYKDNFLQVVDTQIGSFLKALIVSGTYEHYLDGQKKFSEGNLDELNKLLRPVGLRCTMLTLSDPELHPEIQAAMQREAEAGQDAKAQIIKAEAQKRADTLVSEGQAAAIRNLAEAKGKRAKEIYAQIRSAYFSDNDAMVAAMAQVEKEFIAQAVQNHAGTLVLGGNSGLPFAVTEPATERVIEPASGGKR